MSRVTGTFESVARDLERAGGDVVRRGRGATAEVLNAAARDAQSLAFAVWNIPTTSPGRITARMSRNRNVLQGYLIGDGEGGFFQEVGTQNHEPKPVLGPTLERYGPTIAKALAEVAGRLDR